MHWPRLFPVRLALILPALIAATVADAETSGTGQCPAAMAKITGGIFRMGEAPGHLFPVHQFCIDREPVTNAQYKAFVDKEKYTPPQPIFPNSELDDAELQKLELWH